MNVFMLALSLLIATVIAATAQTPSKPEWALMVAIYGGERPPQRHLVPMPDKETCLSEAERFLDMDFGETRDASVVTASCIHNRMVEEDAPPPKKHAPKADPKPETF